MSLFYKEKKKHDKGLVCECSCKNHDDCLHEYNAHEQYVDEYHANEHHTHEHHTHEHHAHTHHHGHSHSKACGCEGEEIDIKRLIAGVALFLIAIVVFNIPGMFKTIDVVALDTAELIAFLLIYLLTANEIVVNSIKNLFKGKALDEQFLMTIASLGAFFVGEYSEACAVMLFYLVGEAFQDYAVDKSRKSITELMDIRPDYANVIKNDGTIVRVNPHSVQVGDLIMVKPGEKIPLDGIVIDGRASLDTSALTGESLPKEICEGENVISGSINLDGLLKIKVIKEFGESTVSKILDLVENASEKKAKAEKFITRFAKIYTPIVVVMALAIAIIPPLINVVAFGEYIGDFYGVWNEWIYRALTFLVISCPCALVISVPLSFFAGIGLASTKGILVKGSNYLEAMALCDTVVFDKTGTLTQGIFKVKHIVANVSDEEFLKVAAVAELHSNHPIAKSIKSALNSINPEALKKLEMQGEEIKIEEIHGKGIKAFYNETCILAGNEKLMNDEKIQYEKVDELGTILYVARDGSYLGCLLIADELKESSKETISTLKSMGVKNTVMLTGDRKEIAEAIAGELGIDKVYSELLPVDKVEHVEELLQESKILAFVGDGVNDAPVLARADVGIAMGAMGSDAAIEAADLVLMDDNPQSIIKAIKLSKRTLNIAKQNITFALAVKVAVLALAALGIASMWAAVFSDVGVCVIAIINAMRCSR